MRKVTEQESKFESRYENTFKSIHGMHVCPSKSIQALLFSSSGKKFQQSISTQVTQIYYIE